MLVVDTNGGIGHTIYRELFDRIIRQDYPAGTRLREDALAVEFAVSRTPIREALSQLAQDRLVRNIPKRGSQVVGFGVDDLEEAFEIRRVLEVLALERGIAAIRISEVMRVRQALEDAAPIDDPALHAQIDSRLHQAMIRAAESPRLEAQLGSLYRIMQTFREIAFEDESVRQDAMGEHLDLIEAIATRDLPQARLLLGDHISRSKSRILAAIVKKGLHNYV